MQPQCGYRDRSGDCWLARRGFLRPARNQPAALDATLPGQALDDVAVLANVAQHRLHVVFYVPLRRPRPGRQRRGVLECGAARPQRAEIARLSAEVRREIDDAGFALVADELSIELCPALGLGPAPQRRARVEVSAAPESWVIRSRAIAHAFLKVVARDDKVLAA